MITSLGRVYASISSSVVLQSAIGTATIFPGGSSSVWSQIVANASFANQPLVYRSFNTSEFANTTYNTEGEISWGSLQGINQGFPAFIPQKSDQHVAWHQNLLADLIKKSECNVKQSKTPQHTSMLQLSCVICPLRGIP